MLRSPFIRTLGAFFRGSFFVARPTQKEKNRLYIIILQRLRTIPRAGSGKQAGENRWVAKKWAEPIWASENGIATFSASNTLFYCTLRRNKVSLQTFCQSLKCHELCILFLMRKGRPKKNGLGPRHHGRSAAGVLFPLRGQARTVEPEKGAHNGHEPPRAESQ